MFTRLCANQVPAVWNAVHRDTANTPLHTIGVLDVNDIFSSPEFPMNRIFSHGRRNTGVDEQLKCPAFDFLTF